MKFNRRLGRDSVDTGSGDTGASHDIIDVMKTLIDICNGNGRGEIDDIDNLGNRRVRSRWASW